MPSSLQFFLHCLLGQLYQNFDNHTACTACSFCGSCLTRLLMLPSRLIPKFDDCCMCDRVPSSTSHKNYLMSVAHIAAGEKVDWLYGKTDKCYYSPVSLPFFLCNGWLGILPRDIDLLCMSLAGSVLLHPLRKFLRLSAITTTNSPSSLFPNTIQKHSKTVLSRFTSKSSMSCSYPAPKTQSWKDHDDLQGYMNRVARCPLFLLFDRVFTSGPANEKRMRPGCVPPASCHRKLAGSLDVCFLRSSESITSNLIGCGKSSESESALDECTVEAR